MEINVIEVVKEYVDGNIEVTGESSLVYDLGLTSYDVAMIFNDLQDRYGVEADIDKVREIKVVNDILNCIKQ